MLSLYEILKASKTGIAPDMWTALAGMNWGGADSGAEVKELTGIPPLTFKADGSPLIDWAVYGNTIQNGTPTPQNPVDVVGCGERTRNLFDKDNADIADLYPDATTREIKQSSNLSTWSIVLPVEPSTTYTFTMGEATTAIRRRVGMCSDYPTKGAYCTSVDDTPEYGLPNLGNIFTTDADTRYVLIMYVSGAGRDVAIERANRVQVVKGNTALPYEPYGYKIPILSGNTTTTVYLGETQSTRRIKKYEFTGQENFQNISSDASIFGVYGLFNEDKYIPLAGAFSTHYKYITNQSDLVNVMHNNDFVMFKQSEALYNIAYKDTLYSDRTDFKAYLAAQYSAGTPVCVWYVLAEPETGIVNEPLRKIGDYADTVSMGQAGAQIPTLHGNTVIDVETELKPSEMYIKYQE